jgi:sec-independent protein translocase protein TatA
MIGWTELTVIFLVALLLFGAKRIPEIARSLGKATKEFKNARDEIVAESNKKSDKPETKDADKPDDQA